MVNACKDIQDYLVEVRRKLHRVPEVGFELPKTRALIVEELEKIGVPYTLSKVDSGLMCEIKGAEEGRIIVLRADMDALPIKEETGLPFESSHEGFMHACGHDAHITMLLGAIKVLNENKDKLKGTARCIFQTAEEISGGAKNLINEGFLDGASAVFGTHIGCILGKEYACGKFIITPGCCMASFDKFVVTVKGKGCHGSTPEKGIDPINIAAHIVLNLQAVIAREFSATHAVVLTIGKIAGGSQYNVIPDEVVIEGTIRALNEEDRQTLARRIGEISKATAAVFGGEAETEMFWGAPPVVNDDEMAAFAADVAKEAFGEENVITSVAAPNMGGEDFAYYLEKYPGVFMFLSSSNPEKGCDVAHHNPKFKIDEDVLWKGSALFAKIAERFLNK